MSEPKMIHFMGGSVQIRPAGSFVDENQKTVTFDDAVKVTYAGKTRDLLPAAVAELYKAIRADKDLQAFVGVSAGILG